MQSKFNRALNKEATYYGLVRLGIICGAIGCILTASKFGLLFGLGGAVPGYLIGSVLSKQIHQGKVQRWFYWHLPSRLILKKSKLPESMQRWFM